MKKYTLEDYLALPGKTKELTARAVGITQGSIYQMQLNKRRIYILESETGEIAMEEIKRIPYRAPGAA